MNSGQVVQLKKLQIALKIYLTVQLNTYSLKLLMRLKNQIEKQQKKIDSLIDRLNRVMEAAIDYQNEKLSEYFSYLATIGATTPFIGLFGTVWGIMNSFQSIAISRNTSLAVVAPGIAEALFATALGLLAAIPAVIAYNIFTSQVNDENARMYRFKEHFNVIFSRGLNTK